MPIKGYMKRLKNSLGLTLTELLVALGMLAILTSIATVSYRGYIQDVEKKDLKSSGILFASAVNTCVQGMGGWQVSKPDGSPLEPCKATTSAELKSKLNFTCPADADCSNTHTSTDKSAFCLSIQKTVSGKKLQVAIVIETANPGNYVQYCGELDKTQSFWPLNDTHCDMSGSQTGHFPGGNAEGKFPVTDKDGNAIQKNGKNVWRNVLVENCPDW